MRMKPFPEWQIIGKVALNPRGIFDSNEAYERLDFVSHNGSSFVALVDGPVTEPTELSEDWQILAKGYPDAENFILGIKGEAEIEYRTGFINLTKEHIGLDQVDNLSLKDIQQNTVSSFSFNGHKQQLKGDIDIPIVNSIIYNGKKPKHGTVHISSIEGIVINDQPVKNGLVVTDMVTGLKINGRYERGKVKLNVPEHVYLNGQELHNHRGRVNIDVVEALGINGRTPEKGILNLRTVESISVNGRESEAGDLELEFVESLSVNGNPPRTGHLDLDVVHGLSVNHQPYQKGFVDLETVNRINFNGRGYKYGDVEIDAIESVVLNGKKLDGQSVEFSAVEGIELNNRPLLLKDGTAEIKAAESVLLNGHETLNENGVAEIEAITSVLVNGKKQRAFDGQIDLNIPALSRNHIYAQCPTKGSEETKILISDSNIPLTSGTILFVNFDHTNHSSNIQFSLNDESYPVVIKGMPVSRHNAETLKKNGLFFFIFDGESWVFLTGTNDAISYFNTDVYEDKWYELDGKYLYDIELPVLADDFVTVLPALGLEPENVYELSQAGIYTYSQEDGKITLGCLQVPQGDQKLVISII